MSLRAALCLALAATGALAQERVHPDVFLDAAVGKTLTFGAFPEGFHIGTEEFLRRDLSVWRQGDDACVYGDITVEDDMLCFFYEALDDTPVCWATFFDGERFLVATTKSGTFEMQQVTSISDDGLSCPVKPGV